jgi:formate-dependent nitrite reductase membrane component NrfD
MRFVRLLCVSERDNCLIFYRQHPDYSTSPPEAYSVNEENPRKRGVLPYLLKIWMLFSKLWHIIIVSTIINRRINNSYQISNLIYICVTNQGALN